MNATEQLSQPITSPDNASQQAALERQGQLTKPPGSLGMLENLAIRLAAMQHTSSPAVERIQISIFAADHGIAAQGTSAFPQAVTGEMVRNFANGGAAICVLSQQVGATLEVINLGTVNDPGALTGVIHTPIATSSSDFSQQAAMTEEQLELALQAGFSAIKRAKENNMQLFIGGEMGIGNTGSATALAAALLKQNAQSLVGPGTGLDNAGVQRKSELIQLALEKHAAQLSTPLEILRHLGGFEIAALVAAYLAAAQQKLPILVDGFISSVAALLAVQINNDLLPWLIFAHQSAEPGHKAVLAALNAEPLLQLNMRLGEGSGAASAVPLLQQACALHKQMATFAEASVSGKST
ncbi:MAG: nicotinate-nucleotide--dimethylbenzimidazole phosphoribosyltransferase [Gammaproteobacteria bacterium]|nr:nicotinate-nucleotide--dimethylbenzimidazole phosphoribosyltransferase [Gammaproteobacteria bacterium]